MGWGEWNGPRRVCAREGTDVFGGNIGVRFACPNLRVFWVAGNGAGAWFFWVEIDKTEGPPEKGVAFGETFLLGNYRFRKGFCGSRAWGQTLCHASRRRVRGTIKKDVKTF